MSQFVYEEGMRESLEQTDRNLPTVDDFKSLGLYFELINVSDLRISSLLKHYKPL